jgi:hypothetical protein
MAMMRGDDWQPIATKPPFVRCEERGIYTDTDGDGLFYFSPTHWRPCGAIPMTQQDKRYEVVDKGTGDRFGNHTYAEACARAHVMARNWQYKKVFAVEERQ